MVWEYNPHEDFVPYYDKLRGRWAVSIQYLDVWYFKTEEEAEQAVPMLQTYQKNVLNWVEEQNKLYYKYLAKKDGLMKRDLKDAKQREPKAEEKLCSQLSKSQQKRLESMLDNGFTDEEIMEVFPINKRAVALKRWHRYKGEKNGYTKGTITRDA